MSKDIDSGKLRKIEEEALGLLFTAVTDLAEEEIDAVDNQIFADYVHSPLYNCSVEFQDEFYSMSTSEIQILLGDNKVGVKVSCGGLDLDDHDDDYTYSAITLRFNLKNC